VIESGIIDAHVVTPCWKGYSDVRKLENEVFVHGAGAGKLVYHR
jgi:hypothetical protein